MITPSPWHWEFLGNAGNYFLVGLNGSVTNGGPDSDDGKVKEAAPELLKACEAFVEAWEKCLQLEKTDVALRLAKAAIAKAKGEYHEIPKSNS